jgi:O-antigen chain-terminating methyltransferase
MKMIEVTHPELDVAELTTRINQEIAWRQADADVGCVSCSLQAAPVPFLWEQIQANVQIARQHAYMGRSVPKMKRLRGVKRRLARWVARGVLYVAQVFTKGQREFNVAAVNSIHDLSNWVQSLERAEQEALRKQAEKLQSRLQELECAVKSQAIAFWKQEAILQRQNIDIGDSSALIQAATEDIDALKSCGQDRDCCLNDLRASWERTAGNLEELRASCERSSVESEQQKTALQEMHNLVLEQAAALKAKDARIDQLETHLAQLKTSSVIQETRLRTLLGAAQRQSSPTGTPELMTAGAAGPDWALESLYVLFEDQFRGSRNEIKERLRFYLPRIRHVGPNGQIVDMGCGRGEWLELLHEEGLRAQGLDANPAIVAECRRRGLEVTEAEALAYLRSLPDSSLSAVTGFHIIEHMPWQKLVSVLDETVRVLRPGGVLIFETPNPENLIVGSCNFHADPTHYKPLFPLTLQFLAEHRGLVNVEIIRLNQRWWARDPLQFLPPDHALAATLNPLIELAKERFYSAPDFAVIGSKA